MKACIIRHTFVFLSRKFWAINSPVINKIEIQTKEIMKKQYLFQNLLFSLWKIPHKKLNLSEVWIHWFYIWVWQLQIWSLCDKSFLNGAVKRLTKCCYFEVSQGILVKSSLQLQWELILQPFWAKFFSQSANMTLWFSW